MTPLDKLKACPFCGGEATDWTDPDPRFNAPCEIVCIKCGGSTGRFFDKQGAIDAWNTRTPDSVVAELVEHCRDEPIHLMADKNRQLRFPGLYDKWIIRLSDIMARLPETKEGEDEI